MIHYNIYLKFHHNLCDCDEIPSGLLLNEGVFMRKCTHSRETRETHIQLELDLDGKGIFEINTGIGFFSHMLETLSKHSLIDLKIDASGDTHVDFHHLVEDCAIIFGQAVIKALGDKKGIRRFGQAVIPLDEALVETVIDISGRPHYESNLTQYSGDIHGFNFELADVFFSGFAGNGFTVHIHVKNGRNLHHIMESAFKSFSRALRMAVDIYSRIEGIIPSAKDFIQV